jgi:prepilin-type N-terminal cleavage/methylation domain-containing protein
MKISRKNNKGFTLIELLLVMSIMGVLAAAFVALQYILSQNQIIAWRSYISVEEANTNLNSIAKEIRTARESENGAYAISSAEDFELIFFTDPDFDGTIERVRYTQNGTSLEKGIIEPTGYPISYPQETEVVKTLTENIRNGTTPVFYYYNANYPQDTLNNPLSAPANPADIKLIRVLLHTNSTADLPDKNFILDTFVQLRMLKDNL